MGLADEIEFFKPMKDQLAAIPDEYKQAKIASVEEAKADPPVFTPVDCPRESVPGRQCLGNLPLTVGTIGAVLDAPKKARPQDVIKMHLQNWSLKNHPSKRAVWARITRPSQLTRSRADDIVGLIMEGCYWESACVECGISPELIARWRDKDYEGASPGFKRFFEVLEQAEHIACNTMARKLFKGGPGWQAAQSWLERRHSQAWQRTEGRDIKGNIKNTGMQTVTFNLAPPKEVENILDVTPEIIEESTE